MFSASDLMRSWCSWKVPSWPPPAPPPPPPPPPGLLLLAGNIWLVASADEAPGCPPSPCCALAGEQLLPFDAQDVLQMQPALHLRHPGYMWRLSWLHQSDLRHHLPVMQELDDHAGATDARAVDRVRRAGGGCCLGDLDSNEAPVVEKIVSLLIW
jgi:hypothetical protein